MTSGHRHNPGFLALVSEAKTRVKHFGIDEFRKLAASGEKFVLIDVREESEWAAGHAKGALHICRGILERDIETHVPDKNTKIVLYCGGGYRSVLSAESLGKMGYTDVISLDGGWRAWKEAGLPVEE
ncbi:MAG TPA: rhodanese-like domain-containing protein [Bryobacteraceae bacterium]|nr:rhodanese-like domain-containing protein [Bryobacteraceae bacterium]